MGHESLWVMEIIGPAILLIVLIWLVMRNRSNRPDEHTDAGTREVYRDEESRRREGTDDL